MKRNARRHAFVKLLLVLLIAALFCAGCKKKNTNASVSAGIGPEGGMSVEKTEAGEQDEAFEESVTAESPEADTQNEADDAEGTDTPDGSEKSDSDGIGTNDPKLTESEAASGEASGTDKENGAGSGNNGSAGGTASSKDAETKKETEKGTQSTAAQETTTAAATTAAPAETAQAAGGSVTISIVCNTILNNTGLARDPYTITLAGNGTILSSTTVSFTEGESVFDILNKVCRANGIPLEYSYTPLYGSYYIEGINNIYEFDVGDNSGWMYRVNGWFPNYGCSSYFAEDGDVIEWIYTCDLGNDIGGGSAMGN